MTTDNLPVMSGYWEKIAALKKQLAFPNKPTANTPKPKSSLEELAELYVNSLDNPQDDAWNAAVSENSQTNSTKPVGSAFSHDEVNRSGDNGQGRSAQNPINGNYTNASNTDPYSIPWTSEQETRKKISDLEREQNNYFAASGGYMTTDNLPVMTGYWEKIAALKKQLAFPNKPTANTPKPKSSLEELAELYVNSLDNPQDDAWNATVSANSQPESTKPVGSMFTNDVVNRSAETAGDNSQPDAGKESGDSTSPIIPIAGGLYYNTKTGEYIDNYTQTGVQSNAGTQSSGAGDYYINPDDYDSDEDYAKALLEGLRDGFGNGEAEEFWVANGYAAGAEGLAALNKDVEDVLGVLGVAIYTDELNNRDEANSGEDGQTADAGTQEAQPASDGTQPTQPAQTQEEQPTQSAPAQIQGTEPVIQMPEYELYSPAEPEQTAAEQIQQTEESEKAAYYRAILDEYYKEIYKDVFNTSENKKSNADEILKKYGYGGGIEGWNALYEDSAKAISVEMDQSYAFATMTGASEEANRYQSIYNDDLEELAALDAQNENMKEYYSSVDGNSYINEGSGGGGMPGGSWGDNAPVSYVTEESSGDNKIVELIRDTDYYKNILDIFEQPVRDHPDTFESEIDVDIVTCDSMYLTGNEAYDVYQQAGFLYYQKGKKQNNLILSALGDITQIPGVSTFFAAADYDSYDEPYWDSNFNGPLEGEYTISHFVMDADWDLIGRGGGEHLYFIGTVFWGPETVELEDGLNVKNPMNHITIKAVYKNEYLDLKNGEGS